MEGRNVRVHYWRNCYFQFEIHGPNNEYVATPYIKNNVSIFMKIKAKI